MQKIITLLKYLGITLLFICILCSPALISYYEFLPYYQRGSGMSAAEAALNPFEAKNLISYLFPSASYKLISGNDISSRNAYIGIVPLILFFLSFRSRWTLLQKWMAILTGCCLLFSFGNATPVRALFYHTIPLMNTFRHPGTIRLFTNIGLIILCGYGWQFINYTNQAFLKKIIIILLAIVCTVFLITIAFTPGLSELIKLIKGGWDRTAIKEFMSASTIYPWLLITGIVQIVTLLACYIYKRKILIPAGIFNMLLMTSFAMPFTTVSQYRPSEVNAFLHSYPKGFPWNKAILNVGDKLDDSISLSKFGYTEFYTKQISLQDNLVTPTVNSAYNKMLHDTMLRKQLTLHPFIYTDAKDSLTVSVFSPNGFTISGKVQSDASIHIIQQYNKNWKAIAGDSVIPVHRSQKAFMMIKVPKGVINIKMEYHPQHIIITAGISLLFLLGCIGSLIYFRAIRL